jgi:hypothetical protein
MKIPFVENKVNDKNDQFLPTLANMGTSNVPPTLAPSL